MGEPVEKEELGNLDADFINRTKTMMQENDDGIRDNQFLGVEFSEDDFILKDEEEKLRNSIKQDSNLIEVKERLERELGKIVCSEVYRVIKKHCKTIRLSYDIEEIKNHIYNELPEFKQEILDLACSKIPDFYSIFFSDMVNNYK